jgi:glycosyltransferase involved in cell wall biosynthesis
MRIGFDAKRLYCNFTGLGNYSRTLLKNLSEYFPEQSYHLYTPKVNENSETKAFTENSKYTTFVSKAWLKSYWRSYSILKQLHKDKIELYHGLSHELPMNIHKSELKSVVTIHDLIFKIYPQTYKRFDRNMYEKKFRYACEHANRIVAISESTKKDIVEFYGIDEQKIDVVYQSINPLYFQESNPNEKQEWLNAQMLPKDFMLYVGSVEARKNLKIVIEAMHGMIKSERIPLVIVGKGTQYKEEVLTLVNDYNLSMDIVWLERLEDNRALKYLYETAKIFIYPSLYEGFGLPVAEALLSKTPVITSNVSSLPEAAGPDSMCVDPMDAEAVKKAIIKLNTDNELRETMIEKGYAYAQSNFSAESAAKSMMQTYIKTLQG